MKKYLVLIIVFLSVSLVKAGVPVYVSSLPDGDYADTYIGYNDLLYISFSEAIRANVVNNSNYAVLIGSSIVYSAKGKFWDDVNLTIESAIIKVNPVNNTQIIIDLFKAKMSTKYNAYIDFDFPANFLQSVSTSHDCDVFGLQYKVNTPILIAQYPSHNANDVLTNDTISLVFRSRVVMSNSAATTIEIRNATTDASIWITNSVTAGNVKVLINSEYPNRVILKNIPLDINTTYKVIMSAGFFKSNLSGGWSVPGINDGDWLFTTREITAVPPFVPANGSITASGTNDFSITFSDNIVANSGYVSIRDSSDNSLVEQINVSSCTISGATLTIPHSALNGATHYYVEMSKGIVKSSTTGYKFKGISGKSTWNFTTGSVNVWTGAQSDDFSNPENWSNTLIGYDNTQPTIIGSGTYPAKISTALTATDVTISSLGKLEITAAGSLTMSGKLTMESTSTSNSSLIVNGSISVSPSNVFIYQFAGNTGGTLKKGYASPVSGATGTSAGTTQSIVKFDNPTAKYVAVPAATTWDAAVGYATYASSPLVFKGALNTATTYSMPLIYTSNPGGGAIYSSPYNFYGNPYTAPLDWKKMWTALTPADTMLVRQTCWVLKESGSWKTINGKTGAVTGGAGTAIPRGHAFMLRAKPPVGGGDASNTIVFRRADLIGGNQTFLKSLSNEVFPANVRLTGISDNFQSDILYGFHSEAQNYFENFDSEYQTFPSTSASFDGRLQIATYNNVGTSIPLVINTVPEFVDSTSFNIAYYVKKEGAYCIELTELDAVFKTPNTTVTLRDTVENVLVTMAEGDKYYFYTTTTPSVVKNRFKITIKGNGDVPTNITQPVALKSTASVYYASSTIHVNLANDELSYVDVYSTNGELVMHQAVSGSKVEVPFEGNGVYIVKVVGNSSSSALKIIANNK